MTFARSKEAVTVVWVLAVALIALVTRPSMGADGALLMAVAIAGVVVLRWLWRRPDETMSESINNARR